MSSDSLNGAMGSDDNEAVDMDEVEKIAWNLTTSRCVVVHLFKNMGFQALEDSQHGRSLPFV